MFELSILPTIDIQLCFTEECYKAALVSSGMTDSVPWVADGYGATAHTEQIDGQLVAIVTMHVRGGVTALQVLGLLVHEATHIKQKYMATLNEQEPSSEFEANVMQHISQFLFGEYERVSRADAI